MRHILAIVDEDILYAGRLADYINAGSKLPFTAVAYAGFAAYLERSTALESEILLISEEIYRKGEIKHTRNNVIILSEEGFIRDREEQEGESPSAILKYSCADTLIREILRIYTPPKENALLRIAGKKSRILGVFSPVNRCGKTENAIAISLVSEQREKTLLLCFDEYRGIFGAGDREYESDLSDVLYCFKQGNYTWDKLSKAAYHEFGLNFIPPARYAEDIAEFSSAELCEIILKIATESDYEVLVIDFGALGKRSVELFELCDIIYIPQAEDKKSEDKLREFYHYLEMTGRDLYKEKFEIYHLDFQKDYLPEVIDDILYSPMGEYWKEKLQGGEI